MGVKQEVFAETAKHVAEGAVLASNTSSLSVGGIGAKTPHPERVVGMHFFNPVDKMPLVEVIAPEGSDPAAVNTVFAFTRKLSFELGPFGINVNAIAPSLTLTERSRPHWNQRRHGRRTSRLDVQSRPVP